MGLLGSIFKGTGAVLGFVTEGILKTTGEIVGTVADGLGAYDLADASRNIGDGLGEFSNKALKTTGNIAGTVIDKTIDVTTEIGGGLGGFIAENCGASYEEIQTAKKVGKVVGGAAGGLLVGDVIGAGVTGTAISSLHGAAQTSAILAHIGGGSLAAGGGMAAGQVLLNGINVATTADGVVSGIKKKE